MRENLRSEKGGPHLSDGGDAGGRGKKAIGLRMAMEPDSIVSVCMCLPLARRIFLILAPLKFDCEPSHHTAADHVA